MKGNSTDPEQEREARKSPGSMREKALIRIIDDASSSRHRPDRIESDILEAFFRNSPDPILFFNSRGSILEQNERADRLWSREELAVSLPPGRLEDIQQVARSGEAIHRRFKEELVPLECRDRVRYFLPSLFAIPERINRARGEEKEKGDPMVVAIMRDETAWELSTRIRNNLLSSISHELNTPLTSARVSLYLLHEQKIGTLNETQQELVASAKEDLDREILTIRELLELIRTEGRLEAESGSDEMLLDRLIGESLANLDELIGSNKLELSQDIQEDLPMVRLDGETARIVVYQVLSLVFKESAPGERIHISAYRKKDRSVMKITSKRGAPSFEHLPQDLFSYPMESPVIRSLGKQSLGLRLVHEMIESKGGSLTFGHSGEGPSLVFEMPVD